MEYGICFYADRPRAGKDHLAGVLASLGFLRVAFADALYEEVSAAFGVTVGFLQTPENKDTPQECLRADLCLDLDFANLLGQLGKLESLSPREALQLWGTEYRRAQDEDYWVNKARDTIQRERPKRLVVTDARFMNEFLYLMQLGCEFWKIIPAGRDSFRPSAGNAHVSNEVGQWWIPDQLLLNIFGSDAAEVFLRDQFGN